MGRAAVMVGFSTALVTTFPRQRMDPTSSSGGYQRRWRPDSGLTLAFKEVAQNRPPGVALTAYEGLCEAVLDAPEEVLAGTGARGDRGKGDKRA
jgi:hypothetical protein